MRQPLVIVKEARPEAPPKHSRHLLVRAIVNQQKAFSPGLPELDQLEADLTWVSAQLMEDALLEVAGSLSDNLATVEDWRQKATAVYRRKLAENAQAYIMLQISEVAYRSVVSSALENHYGVTDWWTPHLRALMGSGIAPKSIRRIGQATISGDVSSEIADILDKIVKRSPEVTRVKIGDHFLSLTTLKELVRLAVAHWSVLKSGRVFPHGAPVISDFKAWFLNVEAARNSIFHPRRFRDQAAAYRSAEHLCQHLGVPLSEWHAKAGEADALPPSYQGGLEFWRSSIDERAYAVLFAALESEDID